VPPLTLQAAFGQARVLSNSRTADQARIVSSTPTPRLADVRVWAGLAERRPALT